MSCDCCKTRETVHFNQGDSQIILYCKGWFKKGNFIEDMKKLVAYRNWINPEDVNLNGIFNALNDITTKMDRRLPQPVVFDVLMNKGYDPTTKRWPVEHRYLDKMCKLIHFTEMQTGSPKFHKYFTTERPDYDTFLPPGDKKTWMSKWERVNG